MMRPSARASKTLWWLIPGLAALALLPAAADPYTLYLLTFLFIGVLLALSFNILFGYMGQLPFGHAAFFGIGAYVVALCSTRAGLPLYVSFPLAVLIAAAFGAVIGFFCVRRTGYYFAVLSMAFGELLHVVVHKWYGFTGGDDGVQGIPVPAIFDSIVFQYYFVLAVVAGRPS